MWFCSKLHSWFYLNQTLPSGLQATTPSNLWRGLKSLQLKFVEFAIKVKKGDQGRFVSGHTISARWLVICLERWPEYLICAYLNILFIIKMKIIVLMKWSYRLFAIMLTTEPRMVSIHWACSPIIFEPICFSYTSFWCHFLDCTSKDMPLEYLCLNCFCVWFNYVYLEVLKVFKNLETTIGFKNVELILHFNYVV